MIKRLLIASVLAVSSLSVNAGPTSIRFNETSTDIIIANTLSATNQTYVLNDIVATLVTETDVRDKEMVRRYGKRGYRKLDIQPFTWFILGISTLIVTAALGMGILEFSALRIETKIQQYNNS